MGRAREKKPVAYDLQRRVRRRRLPTLALVDVLDETVHGRRLRARRVRGGYDTVVCRSDDVPGVGVSRVCRLCLRRLRRWPYSLVVRRLDDGGVVAVVDGTGSDAREEAVLGVCRLASRAGLLPRRDPLRLPLDACGSDST